MICGSTNSESSDENIFFGADVVCGVVAIPLAGFNYTKVIISRHKSLLPHTSYMAGWWACSCASRWSVAVSCVSFS